MIVIIKSLILSYRSAEYRKDKRSVGGIKAHRDFTGRLRGSWMWHTKKR